MDRRIGYALLVVAYGLAPSRCPAAYDRAVLRNGTTVEGMVRRLDASGRLEFSRRKPGPPVAGGDVVEFHLGRLIAPDRAAPPSHRLVIRGAQTLSGRFDGADPQLLYWSDFASGPIAVRRDEVAAVTRRNARQLILSDDFEQGLARWQVTGEARTVPTRVHSGRRALRLGAEPGAVLHALRAPIRAGRVSLWFYDGLDVDPALEFHVRLDFSSAWGGPRRLKVILGWQELRYAVEMTNFESVPVRERVRRQGWHELAVRFGSGGLLVTIDRQVVVHTSRPVEVVLHALHVAAARTGRRRPVRAPKAFGWVDQVQVVRHIETRAHPQMDLAQDEVLLVSGDQLFGALSSVDPKRVVLGGDFGTVTLDWEQVYGVYFGRRARVAQILDGWVVSARSRHGDAWWGTLERLDVDWLEMTTTFAGRLKVARGDVRYLRPLFRGRRYEIDDDYHHLGNSFDRSLAVPHPEGTELTKSLLLPEAPKKAFVACTVVHMVGTGADEDPDWRAQLARGHLRTTLTINGQPVGAINDQVTRQSDQPVRVRIPVPPGLLRKGDNTFEIRTSPQEANASEYDDFGVWGLALEVEG